MTPEELLQQAIEEAIRLDDQSKPRKKLLTTSERNIAFHIGASLRRMMKDNHELTGYQVDVEYNRQGKGDDPKNLGGKRVIPDIAVHKRGITDEENEDANYLYIEIKVIHNFTGTRDTITNKDKRNAYDKDKHKLTLARSEKHYKHAAFLIFNKHGRCFLEIDADSQDIDSFRLVPLSPSM